MANADNSINLDYSGVSHGKNQQDALGDDRKGWNSKAKSFLSLARDPEDNITTAEPQVVDAERRRFALPGISMV